MADNKTEASQWWRLVRKLTVVQASLLALGIDPQTESNSVEALPPEDQPLGYTALKLSILYAIDGADLPGRLVDWDGTYSFAEMFDVTECDPAQSLVYQSQLFAWLKAQGFPTGLLYSDESNALGPRDRNHPRYAPKLALALAAWEAFDETPAQGRPKQRLLKWAEQHAAEFGLLGEDGEPIKTAMDEISIVANWDMAGGRSQKAT
jgi:hypothetical protein